MGRAVTLGFRGDGEPLGDWEGLRAPSRPGRVELRQVAPLGPLEKPWGTGRRHSPRGRGGKDSPTVCCHTPRFRQPGHSLKVTGA